MINVQVSPQYQAVIKSAGTSPTKLNLLTINNPFEMPEQRKMHYNGRIMGG